MMGLRKEKDASTNAKRQALATVTKLRQGIAEQTNQIKGLNQQKAGLLEIMNSFFKPFLAFHIFPIHRNIIRNESTAPQLAIKWDGINKVKIEE